MVAMFSHKTESNNLFTRTIIQEHANTNIYAYTHAYKLTHMLAYTQLHAHIFMSIKALYSTTNVQQNKYTKHKVYL
jgi:hypothetical protein